MTSKPPASSKPNDGINKPILAETVKVSNNNPYAWYEFVARLTKFDQARLDDIAKRHKLTRCPFVDALRSKSRGMEDIRAFMRDPEWTGKADEYVGERHRYSARFLKPFDNHVVGSGPTWDFVAGEFDAV